jgi:hypothetical protein
MFYQQKHIDQPMSLSETKLRQGGQYAIIASAWMELLQQFFPIFYSACRPGEERNVVVVPGPEERSSPNWRRWRPIFEIGKW